MAYRLTEARRHLTGPFSKESCQHSLSHAIPLRYSGMSERGLGRACHTIPLTSLLVQAGLIPRDPQKVCGRREEAKNICKERLASPLFIMSLSSSATSDKRQQQQSSGKRSFQVSTRKSLSLSSSAWKDLPSFCDVAAAVSAPTFAARRLPELQQLWHSCTTQKQHHDRPPEIPTKSPTNQFTSTEIPYLSGGGKPSSRHLRRRITSYASTKRHRFPQGRKGIEEQTPPNVTPKQNVQKSRRARRRNWQGLQQTRQAWVNGGGGTSTTNVVETIAHHGVASSSTSLSVAVANEAGPDETKDACMASSCSSPVFWMSTHLWHAKRFHMVDLWQWKVPLLHTNRGTRATLRLARDGGTLVQDVTWKYSRPIGLLISCGDLSMLPLALAPSFPSIPFTKSVLCGMQVAEGMLHQPNQFPRGAISPARILICCCTSKSERCNHASVLVDGASGSNTDQHYRVYVWVHPSVRSDALACLQDYAKQSTMLKIVESEPISLVSKSPKACLQVRGKTATEALCQLSLLGLAGSSLWEWTKLRTCPYLHELLPHGSVVFVRHDNQEGTTQGHQGDQITVTSEFDTMNHADEIENVQGTWESSQDVIHAMNLESLQPNDMMLVSHCPRNPNIIQNAGCCGWDVFMDPQKLHDIFLTLVLKGNACVIGMLDEAQLRLECDPPLLVFPRDYPDTKEGIHYWQSRNHEWRLVRACLEGGWGRVNVAGLTKALQNDADWQAILDRKLRPIHWNMLVAESAVTEKDGSVVQSNADTAKESGSHVVVMRGAQFGQPLFHAMQCCGQLPPLLTTEVARRRKRRKVKASHEPTHTIPNSREQLASLHEMIGGLLKAMSLPAVMTCRVLVHGQGTLDSGFRILACHDGHADELIGFVTAGAFSPARGCCDGVGIIGTARFLRSLQQVSCSAAAGRVVMQSDGSRQVEALALVACKDKSMDHKAVFHQATISILLE